MTTAQGLRIQMQDPPEPATLRAADESQDAVSGAAALLPASGPRFLRALRPSV